MAVPAQETIEFAICRPLARANLGELCERVCNALESSGAGVAICDLSKARADAVTVEALARLQLEARRRGCRASLCSPSSELLALVEFMGLSNVLLYDW
jgi:ABC-type transporter Mla MlaB component